MTPRDFVDQLCSLRPAWAARRDEIHANAIYYADAPDFGRELLEAARDGVTEPWVAEGFALIERALGAGDQSTQNLVVIGLFEAMQNFAIRQSVPAEVIERSLGPGSRKAWAELTVFWARMR